MAWQHILTSYKKFLTVLAIVMVLGSCEEVIDVNLINEIPKIVIESYITNTEFPITVKITKSQDFFNQANFAPVKKASVQIECLSEVDKLIETDGGYYISSKIKGESGRTYTLKITADGKTYGASVELPQAIPIDTVYFKPGLFQNDSLNIFVRFHDPVKTENYYRIRLFRNNRYAINDYFLLTDAFSDGQKIVAPIYYRYFTPGDTVMVELENLERNTWRYFKGLSEAIQQGVNSQAPGNPPSNLTNGALGIFGAWGSSTYRVIVPVTTSKN